MSVASHIVEGFPSLPGLNDTMLFYQRLHILDERRFQWRTVHLLKLRVSTHGWTRALSAPGLWLLLNMRQHKRPDLPTAVDTIWQMNIPIALCPWAKGN